MFAAFLNLGCGQSQAVVAFKNNEELVPADHPNDGTTTVCTRLQQRAELSGLLNLPQPDGVFCAASVQRQDLRSPSIESNTIDSASRSVAFVLTVT